MIVQQNLYEKEGLIYMFNLLRKTAVAALCIIFAAFSVSSCGDAQISSAEKAFKSCMNAALEGDLEKAKEYVSEGDSTGNNIIAGIESMRSSFINAGLDEEIINEFFKAYTKNINYKIKESEKRGSNHVYITYDLTAPDYKAAFEFAGSELKNKYADLARKEVSEEDVMRDLTASFENAIKEAGSSTLELLAVVEKTDENKWTVDFHDSEDIVFE